MRRIPGYTKIQLEMCHSQLPISAMCVELGGRCSSIYFPFLLKKKSSIIYWQDNFPAYYVIFLSLFQHMYIECSFFAFLALGNKAVDEIARSKLWF